MPFENIAFKSYCWCLGTTSFRTKNFNRTIEEQLDLLSQFWKKPENKNQVWQNNNDLQENYYYFLQDNGFVDGDAPRPDKDAREKTSGLVDIGLITANRRLTEAGEALLQISRSQNFEGNNILQIDADSFIYLKQLLKTDCDVDGNKVRPFIVLLRILLDEVLNGYISKDEFTYILPLCINRTETEDALADIRDIRRGTKTIDEAIMDVLMHMSNYRAAKSLFLNNPVSEGLICTIGMNRKSRDYDRPYYPVYRDLYQFYMERDHRSVKKLLDDVKKLKLKTAWMKVLFTTSNRTAILSDPLGCSNVNEFTRCTNEREFKEAFFNVMHLLKAKATLSDYYDLNKRYLSTADVLLFEDEKVSLDVIPKQFFANCIDELYKLAFTSSAKLQLNCKLEDISPSLIIQEQSIIQGLQSEYDVEISDMREAMSLVDKQRYERLNSLIDDKFTDNKIIAMLDLLDERNDEKLMTMVTDNADAPTIFEYILGILWYKLSGRHGKILDYLKLSLDTNLLPKSHAAGGEADIVYEYEETSTYPAHCLLLEATLADKNNQRRMEMEPVSRHIGGHRIANNNPHSYCIFATNTLNPNVISDFRLRKYGMYYDPNDPSKYVEGLKIIPLETKDLRSIIRFQKKYPELYVKFEEAYQDDKYTNPFEWWMNCVRKPISA